MRIVEEHLSAYILDFLKKWNIVYINEHKSLVKSAF